MDSIDVDQVGGLFFAVPRSNVDAKDSGRNEESRDFPGNTLFANGFEHSYGDSFRSTDQKVGLVIFIEDLLEG